MRFRWWMWTTQRRPAGRIALCVVLVALLAACGGETTRERFPPAAPGVAALQPPRATAGPVPGSVVRFPQDEAPHNVLSEWWYYTGRVTTRDGAQYGIQFVVFQGSRADLPIGYAAHFAVIDAATRTFTYEQATASAPAARFGGDAGFDLRVGEWTMRGLNGTDTMQAAMASGAYAIAITAQDRKGPTLQGGGQFSYGPGGSSYYYSRTRMTPTGTITVGGVPKEIVGGALWFDHQWGDFLPTNGGWDWFSTQLDDGSEVMVYNLRDAAGVTIQTFGTYIPPRTPLSPQSSVLSPAPSVELTPAQFTLAPLGQWTSPATGITYPAGWRLQIAAAGDVPAMALTYTPIVADAELDTRASTGVVYWEGDTTITGTKNGAPVRGGGYVELTGYGA